jgi:hypothetical protein
LNTSPEALLQTDGFCKPEVIKWQRRPGIMSRAGGHYLSLSYFCRSNQPVLGIILLAHAEIHIVAMTAIVSSSTLALDDINPMTHIDRSKHKGPIDLDWAL